MDAETVARELYALRPGEFVAARDAKVAEARHAGERELASQIKSMRRPTVSAWVMNLFALERGERLEQLFSLGHALREAQASLSGDTLRRLDEQRRQVIAELAGEAAKLAAQRGQAVPSQAVADVERTLYAALADPDAAASVKAARLTTGLSFSGFGEIGAAPGTPVDGPGAADDDPEAERDGGVDARREQLRSALRAAEQALTAASEDVEQARQHLDQTRARRDQRASAVDELEAQLAEARSLLSDAQRDVDEAEAAVKRTQAAADDARAAAESAQSAASNG